MKPLLYGYLRLDVAGERIGECETRIRSFADREGYDLGMVFHERRCGRAALDALIAELRRAECRNVVVPSVEHLTASAALTQAAEARLWCEAGAWVLIAATAARSDADGQTEGQGTNAGTRNTRQPIAIGLIRTDVSGPRTPEHAEQIRRHAVRMGYVYACTVQPPADNADPIGYVLGLAAGLGVDAIVVYDLETVGHTPSRVCELFDLETVSPPATWAASVLSPDDAAHAHPEQPLTVVSAHRILQQHLKCQAVACARKSSAYSFLVRHGKIIPPADTPRERAAARGIPFRPRPDRDAPLPEGVKLETLLDILAGLAEYSPVGTH